MKIFSSFLVAIMGFAPFIQGQDKPINELGNLFDFLETYDTGTNSHGKIHVAPDWIYELTENKYERTESKRTAQLLNCDNGSINIVGAASEINAGTDSYELTPDEFFQAGAVWSESFIDLSSDFTITADLNFGDDDDGADGIVFVLQGECNGEGSDGEGIGYQGIGNSVAVEFDDFENFNLDDPAEDHVGIQAGGIPDHGDILANLAGPNILPNLEDGADHPLEISWLAGTQTLTVMLDGATVIEYTGDIVNDQLNGLNDVYWGFTSATGGSKNLHQVKNICMEAATIPTSEIIPADCDNPNTTINFLIPGADSASISYTGPMSGDVPAGATSITAELAPGEYAFTVVDANGCESGFSITVPEAVNGDGIPCDEIECDFTVSASESTNFVMVSNNNVFGFMILNYSIDPIMAASISIESDNPDLTPPPAGFFNANGLYSILIPTEFPCGEPWPFEGTLLTATIADDSCTLINETVLTLDLDQLCPNEDCLTCPEDVTLTLDICNEYTLTPADLNLEWCDSTVTPDITLSQTDFTEPGTTAVTVMASDGFNTGSCVINVTMEVNADLFTVTAEPDTDSTCPEEAITISADALLANDSASNGEGLEIQELTLDNPTDGDLIDNGDGTWTFTPAAGFTGDVQLSYLVKLIDGSLFFSGTGHYYEFVAAQGIEWTDAKAAAEASTLNGLQGYLATITSQEENDFITTKLQGNGWMGASDEAVEGEWRWVTGPETGQQFWQGGTSGSSVNGMYQNWQVNSSGVQIQPDNNNAGLEENFGHFLPDGQWNDWPIIENAPFTDPNGYVVEYGGLEDCSPDFTATGTLTISVEQGPLCPAEGCLTCPEDVTLTLDICGEYTLTAADLDLEYCDSTVTPDISLSQTIFTEPGTTVVTVTSSDGVIVDSCVINVTMAPNPEDFTITAGPDADSTCPLEAITISADALLANDSASNGEGLEIQELTLDNPADGDLVDNGDGTWTFTPAVGFTGDVQLSYLVKAIDGSLFFSGTGHFYEYIPAENITWTEARDAAAASTLNGLQGYLATITSQEENDFIQTKLEGFGWIGGAEYPAEGTNEWFWVTGPEADTQFADGATSVNGMFTNWNAGEPNNNYFGSPEAFVHLRADGTWNDYPESVTPMGIERIDGYVVEYGGLENCPPEFNATGTLTITVELTPDCEEVCEACPGDMTPPEITCPDDVVITAEEYENLINGGESIFGGFTSEYAPVTFGPNEGGTLPEGSWVVTSDASAYHPLFTNCDDADGNPDGDMLVFNGATETGVSVYCQDVEVIAGTTYDMSVMVASVLEGNPAMIQFAVDDIPVGNIHTAVTETCIWTELTATWTASTSGHVNICVLNQNNAGGGNDFALDNFVVTAEDGTNVQVGGDLGEATATDDCGEVTPTFEDVEEVGECATIITRTWTAVDSCGNQSSCVQTITVSNSTVDCTDTIPPVISGVEVFIIGECGEISPEDLGVTATDNEDCVTLTFVEIKFSPGCLGTLQRTYTATDACGNMTQVVQIIDLTNENGPIIECPEDETYQCLSDVPPAVEPEVSHGCDLEIVRLELEETMEGDTCSMVITRTWTAEDECGGISTCSQTITVEDTEAPVPPAAPDPLTLQCADQVPSAEELTAQDNCSGPITSVPTEVRVDGDCPNSFVITRTWTFTDECDNVSSVSQTITVEDTEAPVPPTAPDPVTVQCEDEVPTPEELTAQDNCSGPIIGVPSDEITPGDCPNNYIVRRTWTFTDECENVSSVSQTITVNDTIAPVAPPAPDPVTVQCADDVPAGEALTADDNCDGPIEAQPVDVVEDGDCPNSFTVTRTWTFTDVCGNSSSVSQTITVNDTIAPVAPPAPDPVTVQCADDVPAGEALTADDNCDGPIEAQPVDVVEDGDCPNSFTVTRTWTFTDVCGNSSSVSQTITVNDTIAPVAPPAPDPVTVQCADDVPAGEALTADDNCDGSNRSATSRCSGRWRLSK